MAAHILRLRLSLLVGTLRGDSRHVTRVVVGLVILTIAAAAGCRALLTLAKAPEPVMFAVTVLGGSAVTLGFVLAPLIAGVADPLDPRRFTVFGLSPVPLAGVLGILGFVSVPAFVTAAFSAFAAAVWIAHGAPWGVAVLGGILQVATCVLIARVFLALTSMFLAERRSRELSGLFALTILVVVVPVAVFLASLEWNGVVPTQLTEAAQALAITPLGAAVAFPGLVASGSTDAPLSLLVALGTIVVLAAVWVWLVQRILTTTERPVSNRQRGGLGWFSVAPGTPGGAIAARSLIYWLGDRRYLANLIIIPIAAGLTMVPLVIAGVPPQIIALVPVPLAALFLGWLPHNDLAYDSTAVWMHFAAGIRGSSDRIGRLVPILLIGIPALAIAIPFAISIHGRWALLPAMAGVCASLFLSGLGLSSISSVVWPYPASTPGESPFRQPQRVGAGSAITQSFVMLGALVLSGPALWWAWVALTADIEAATMALWGGVTIGLTVLLIGIGIGSLAFRGRSGRLMEFAESN